MTVRIGRRLVAVGRSDVSVTELTARLTDGGRSDVSLTAVRRRRPVDSGRPSVRPTDKRTARRLVVDGQPDVALTAVERTAGRDEPTVRRTVLTAGLVTKRRRHLVRLPVRIGRS